MKSFLTSLFVGSSLIALTGLSADWPQWRGPNRDDRSPDKGLLKAWPDGGPKRVWLNTNAGLGYAGYSIVGDRLFTLGLRDGHEHVLALNTADGKELWATPAGTRYPNDWGDGPRMTPTVDGGHVYAIGGQGLLVCLNAQDGKLVWQKSLVADLGGKLEYWGYSESPLIVGDVLVCTPGGTDGTMAGLNKKTGEVLWRTKELTDPTQYSSPIFVEHDGRKQAVQLVMKRFFGVNVADGKVAWSVDFPGKTAVIPTPVFHDGIVYVTSGYGVGSMAVKLEAGGKTSPVFDETAGPSKAMKNHHGGVVLVGDHIYGYSDGNGWVCQEFRTGKEVWASKSFGKGAVHYADGMLYCLDEKTGEVALVEASPKGWKQTGRFKLDPLSEKRNRQGGIWPHPVVINGHLYLRDQENLFCFDVKGS
jgi:outer membrane protein assembly factor BamB